MKGENEIERKKGEEIFVIRSHTDCFEKKKIEKNPVLKKHEEKGRK